MSDTHSLQTYISDMLALEQHVRIPFESQLNDSDLAGYPGADTLMRRLRDLSSAHVAALEQTLSAHGGHEAHPLKGGVSSVEGWFASAIDKMRKTKIAKALRDDYTAVSLCTVSYSMLLATANAFGAADVAALAQRHLTEYAGVIMDIGLAMPSIVVEDLKQTGLEASSDTVSTSRSQVGDAWRSASASQRQSTTGTVESDALLNRADSGTYPTV